MIKVLIIGFGKVGSHLCNAIKRKNSKYSVTVSKSSRHLINKRALSDSDVIIICVQDDKIGNAVKSIIKSGAILKGKITAHTSGTLTSDELEGLKKRGARIASFHPVQTFNRKARPNDRLFENIYTAIEGNTYALKILRKIARDIGSIPVNIEKDFKTLHHICCVISSSYTAAGFSIIDDIYTLKNGFKKVNFLNIYMPLVKQTISNIESDGIEKSLTGPIVRNDVKTLQKHIEKLETLKSKEIVDYYRFNGHRILNILHRNERITGKQFHELKKLLKPKTKN